MCKLGKLECASVLLLMLGGLNYGFVAVLNLDLIRFIFGATFGNMLYILFCLASIYLIYAIWQKRKEIKEDK